MSYFEILDRLKPVLPTVERPTPREVSRALVVDNPETGHTYVTVPLSRASLNPERFLTRLSGRLVGAGTNSNGQAWTGDDLAFGLPSVAGGPLNWLHQERTIIGALTGADLVGRQSAVLSGDRTIPGQDEHIRADAVVWSFLYPREARTIAEAADAGQAYFSMECVSATVQCHGPDGCGALMPYADALARNGAACEHIRARAAARRFVDPVFQGAAVIVPPVQPGWTGAHLDLVRQAASTAGLGEFTGGHEELAAQILAFVQGGSAPTT